MKNGLSVYCRLVALTAILVFLTPLSCIADRGFGGITFIGDRQGICVEIDGDCVSETISFELTTCDANQVEKERYRDKMPFTLLVPVGTHNLTIKKDGRNILSDKITITAEKVLEYNLP